MKIDSVLRAGSIEATVASAVATEDAGFDGIWTAETAGDPFLPLALAAEHTTRPELGTAIAVAFARNPMSTAYTAYDLQRMAGGRFVLGLGSQVRAHIERRFSMPWSHPARRMREYVLALRAIWASWEDEAQLEFEGEFYRHTLMTPFFTPVPHGFSRPRVLLAGVGQVMTEVAGEVCDGLLIHPFTTPRYLQTQLIPAIERGAARAGRSRVDLELSLPCFVATGCDEQQIVAEREKVRERIAFYGSTPAYRAVLDVHGWGGLADELHSLSRSRDDHRWTTMTELVSDQVVETFAVVGSLDRIGPELASRYGGQVDRVTMTRPSSVAPEAWSEVVAATRAAASDVHG